MFSLNSRDDLNQAIVGGGVVCFLLAGMQILNGIIISGGDLDGAEWAVVGAMAAFYVGCGIGALKKSRIAISLGLSMFVADIIYASYLHGVAAALSLLNIAGVIVLAAATIATFRYQQKFAV